MRIKLASIVLVAVILLAFNVLNIYFASFKHATSAPKANQNQSTVPSQRNGSTAAPSLSFSNPAIDKIFANDHTWTATLSGNARVRTLIATGDIIPARMVNIKVLERNDFLFPYRKTVDLVSNADITFGNLESPLLDRCNPTREGMVFCGSSKHIEGVKYAGIDVLNLANNHTGNYQASGVNETIKHIQDARIDYTGTGSATIREIRGKKWAFLGFSEIGGTCCGVREATIENINHDIRLAKQQADMVIVQFHWGVEYREDPDDNQKQLGRAAIDARADLVIGNHPHWVQGIEYYKGKLITYAHGNYVFDQMWSIETTQGVIGKYTFYDDQLIDVQYTPIVIEDYVQPRLANTSEGKTIIDRMLRSSRKLQEE